MKSDAAKPPIDAAVYAPLRCENGVFVTWTRAVLMALFVVAVAACKRKSPPAPPAPTVVNDGGGHAAPSPNAKAPLVQVTAIAVSSRVENDTDKPGHLADGDLETSWSSKAGDLEGAWVQMLTRVAPSASIAALHMTVGPTKKADEDGDGDLFLQSPRISEVSLSWAKEVDAQLGTLAEENVIADRTKLDPESRVLQRIPISLNSAGVLRITIKRVKMGTKPTTRREVSISEIELESDTGARFRALKPGAAYVGTIFDPKPRGILGIVPEKAPPFGCHALALVAPDHPRVYCVLGFTTNVANNRGNAGELVTLERSGAKALGGLIDEDAQFHVPYGLWLRTEKELKTAQARPLTKSAAVKAIPWNGSIEVNGATFRQRETERDPPNAKDGELFNILNGELEVKWPGTDTFVPIFRAWPGIPPTTTMIADVRSLAPTLLLVERSMHHASTSTTSRGAEASICDLSAKKCTAYPLPTPETIEEK